MSTPNGLSRREPVKSDASLSWDGTLCGSCRRFFDDFIAHNEPKKGDIVRHIRPVWPHDLQSTKWAAASGCRLCLLILHNTRPYLNLQDISDDSPSPVRQGADLEASLEWITGLHFDLLVSVHASLLKNDTKSLPAHGAQHITVLIARIQLLPDSGDTVNPPKLSDNTGSSETISKIQTWLGQCEKHSSCRRLTSTNDGVSALPSRLVKIDEAVTQPNLRLVTPNDVVADVRYTTLSHCWGGNLPIMLRRNSLQRFMVTIPWDSMPRTFRDAVLLTRALGFQYIWIDALCIMQDVITDWSEESGKMASIYANAELNISASHASNSTKGLFKDRDIWKVASFNLQSTNAAGDHRTWMCYADSTEMDISQAPIHSRAWVVQERFLARRVVYFGQDQVHWECACHITSEALPSANDLEFPRGEFLGKGFQSNADQSLEGSAGDVDLYNFWERAVQIFSKCDLTIISDRPVAISGIARVVGHRLSLQPSDYLCGLWRPRLMHGLMWWSIQWRNPYGHDPDTRCRRSSDRSIPSWSWLSVIGSVCFEYLSDGSLAFEDCQAVPVGQILEAKTFPTGTDFFGPIARGHIKIRSILRQAQLSRCKSVDEKVSHYLGGIDGFKIELAGTPSVNLFGLKLHLDDGTAHDLGNSSEQTIHLMLGFIVAPLIYGEPSIPPNFLSAANILGRTERLSQHGGSRPGDDVSRCHCLVLMPAHASGTFRRIGYCSFFWPSRCYRDRAKQPEAYAIDVDANPGHFYEESADDGFSEFVLV